MPAPAPKTPETVELGYELTANAVLDKLGLSEEAPWCSGQTCHPVTVEIVGSNPIGVVSNIFKLMLKVHLKERLKFCPQQQENSKSNWPGLLG